MVRLIFIFFCICALPVMCAGNALCTKDECFREEEDDGYVDEYVLVAKINKLEMVVQDKGPVNRIVSLLENEEFDDDIVLDCLLDGYEKGEQFGRRRAELIEDYIGKGGEADLLVYYLSEGGKTEPLIDFFGNQGTIVLFEKLYSEFSIEIVVEKIGDYNRIVGEQGVEDAVAELNQFLLEESEENE